MLFWSSGVQVFDDSRSNFLPFCFLFFVCASSFARQLLRDDAGGSGCNLDNEFVWSTTPCEVGGGGDKVEGGDGYMVATGSAHPNIATRVGEVDCKPKVRRGAVCWLGERGFVAFVLNSATRNAQY